MENHRNADAATLDCLDKGSEKSVAQQQDHLVDLIREIQGIDSKLDVQFPLTFHRPLTSVNSL